ncbi:hypothetical protein [Jiulongibacter sp. NS-SX5]|uniref:hypothetical protein n=1 Tax=Jiulongibacter sp. NS-SX5 TaxID=3463854 RepID=UPI004059BCA5
MKYVLILGHNLTDKNKLQTEIKYLFEKNERKVFETERACKALVNHISIVAHEKHPRCKPITLELWKPGSRNDLHLCRGLGLDVRFYELAERNESVSTKPDTCAEEEYFIRTEGYSGNSLIWWRPNSQGYTSDLKKAGKYSKEEAESICRGRGTELAYKSSKVLGLPNGLFTTVHADYLRKDDADIDFRPHLLAEKEVSDE